jgi:hypothetical protein
MKQYLSGWILWAAFGVAAHANASTVVLNFAGLDGNSQEAVENFYNGRTGSLGSSGGTNYGISFGSNAIVCSDQPPCNAGEIPGGAGANALFFLVGSDDLMNVAAGFTTGFSFYYTAINNPGTVNVYSGLNDTGTLLATVSLPLTPDGTDTPGCSGQPFCPFYPVGVSFAGTAQSVDFTGSTNDIGFADITLGSATAGGGTPVPLPPAAWLLLFGLAGLGFVAQGRTALSETPRSAT